MNETDLKGFVDKLEGQFDKLTQCLEGLFNNIHIGQQNELLTKYECMNILKCTNRTLVYLLHEKKTLPYLKVGKEVRIKRSDLDKFIESLQPVDHHQF